MKIQILIFKQKYLKNCLKFQLLFLYFSLKFYKMIHDSSIVIDEDRGQNEICIQIFRTSADIKPLALQLKEVLKQKLKTD